MQKMWQGFRRISWIYQVWIVILSIVLVLAFFIWFTSLISPSSSASSQPTITPNPNAPHMVFNQSSSTQNERSSAFTISGSHQVIEWSCDLSSSQINYAAIDIEIYTASGARVGYGVIDQCEPGNTSGQNTISLVPGQYKLNISIMANWHIKVIDYPPFS